MSVSYGKFPDVKKGFFKVTEGFLLYHTTLYNFYAALEVNKAILHKACTKSAGFFAVWSLATRRSSAHSS